jgi:CDP-diacylglycerol--glycerol-3-phosphate 3-phosphatidyltransferase
MPMLFSLEHFSYWLAALLGLSAEWQIVCQYVTSTKFISDISVAFLHQRLSAMSIFIVAALTDKLDGFMARKWNWITKFGTVLDPIVDKLLVIPSLVALSYVYYPIILWLPTAIITVREIYVAVRQNYFRKGNIQIEVIYSGKKKMVIQCVAISLFFLPLVALWQLVPWTSIIYATYSTIKSGIDYHKEFVKAEIELKKISGRD